MQILFKVFIIYFVVSIILHIFAVLKTNFKMNELDNIITYETFFEDVWEEVSYSVVSDDLWEKNEDKFQELTFDLYQYYKRTHIQLSDGQLYMLIPVKTIARMIESFVKNFIQELS